jgi:hypothetical protein
MLLPPPGHSGWHPSIYSADGFPILRRENNAQMWYEVLLSREFCSFNVLLIVYLHMYVRMYTCNYIKHNNYVHLLGTREHYYTLPLYLHISLHRRTYTYIHIYVHTYMEDVI